jgi:hypothetical protein
MFGGESCSEIAASPHGTTSTMGSSSVQQSQYYPSSLSESIKLSSESHIAGSIVYVNLSAFHTTDTQKRPSLPQVVRLRPELVAEVLSNMLVTLPCTHEYYDRLLPPARNMWRWVEGLSFSGSEASSIEEQPPEVDSRKDSLEPIVSTDRNDVTIYYQTVDGNGLYQWLACHFASENQILCVMQHKACITCTIAAVKLFVERNPHKQKLDVCIVPG